MDSKQPKLPKVSLEQPPDEFVRTEREYPDDPDVQAYIYSNSKEAEEENKSLRESIKRAKAKLQKMKEHAKQSESPINYIPNEVEFHGSGSEKLTAEKIGEFIQKNIVHILENDGFNEFELPKIKNDYIDSMTLKIKNNDDGSKKVLLALRDEEHPEIAVELAKGSSTEIIKNITKPDFVEEFVKIISDLESVFIYR